MKHNTDVYVAKMMRCEICGQPYAYEEEDCPCCYKLPRDEYFKKWMTMQEQEWIKNESDLAEMVFDAFIQGIMYANID